MTDQSSAEPVLVTLQVFSGRPDPRWALEPGKLQELADRFANSHRLETAAAPPTGQLGYRGFLVQVPRASRAAATLPATFEVHAGVLTVGDEHWTDRSGLERFLLDDASAHGHEALLVSAGARAR